MYPFVIGAILGAALMGRTKARTQVKKYHLLGPRSGGAYECEEFPQTGFVVLHAPDKSVGSFQRKNGRYQFLRGSGQLPTINTMRVELSAE